MFVAQLERMSLQMQHNDDNEMNIIQSENNRLNMLLAQLIPTNKELQTVRERQQLEMDAQRNTLEEQRNHIHILDKALHNAQMKVVALEQEVRRSFMLKTISNASNNLNNNKVNESINEMLLMIL
jgi:hypothetical protein